MEVKHDESRQEFYVELEGHRAHVSYKFHDEGSYWRERHSFCVSTGSL